MQSMALPTMPRVCKAYKSLNDKLKDHCKRYRLFHRNEQFGAFPGMYKDHPFYKGEEVPDVKTSNYFRGGIINTIAIFEAFLMELLEEACTDNGHPDESKVLQDHYKEEFSGKSDKSQYKNIALFHNWKKIYTKCLFKEKNPNEYWLLHRLFSHTIKYYYVINNEKTSLIKIGAEHARKSDDLQIRREKRLTETGQKDDLQDESIICTLLRLFYGIRCVMAHGDPKKTLEENALKKFPKCSNGNCPGRNTEVVLQAASDLEEYCCKIKKKVDDAKDVENKIRRVPKKEVFKDIQKQNPGALSDEEWSDIFKIIDKYFPHDPDVNPLLPASFAFFHMCRVDEWLRRDKIDKDLTYRMLVRVNQFIHMLAFRLTIAVKTILEEVHKLPSGFWEIPVPKLDDKGDWIDEDTKIIRSNIPDMIDRFERRHEEIVKHAQETLVISNADIEKICKDTQETAIERLKEVKEFKSTKCGVWRVQGTAVDWKVAKDDDDSEEKDYVVKSYLSVVIEKKKE